MTVGDQRWTLGWKDSMQYLRFTASLLLQKSLFTAGLRWQDCTLPGLAGRSWAIKATLLRRYPLVRG